MKKIKVTIVARAMEEYPGCADILGACPEIEIVARPGSLHETGVWSAVSTSNVLLLDEAVLARDGGTVLRAVQQYHPLLRLLLVVEKTSENMTMDALALGFSGVIERASLPLLLRRAIPVLSAGEIWVSRQLVRSLRTRWLRSEGDALPGVPARIPVVREKIN